VLIRNFVFSIPVANRTKLQAYDHHTMTVSVEQ